MLVSARVYVCVSACLYMCWRGPHRVEPEMELNNKQVERGGGGGEVRYLGERELSDRFCCVYQPKFDVVSNDDGDTTNENWHRAARVKFG